MATPSKKGNRNFDFGKPQKRTFDFTKDDEDSLDSSTPLTIPSPQEPKSKIWPWYLLGVIVVCVISYFIFSKFGYITVTEPEPDTEIIEETIVSINPVDNQEEATEEILSAEENDVSNNADNQEAKVNEVYVMTDNTSNIATTTASNANVSNDVEAEAMKVIRGDYGLGQERKDKLGSKYQSIQNRVNELKREGVF